MRHSLAALTILFLAALPAFSLEKVTEHTVKLSENESPARASVSEMAWLAGRWTGDGLGGRTEEEWSAPDASVMLGTFRLIREGEPVFFEFLTLGQTDRGLAMRLKHFNPDLTGWEEKEKVIEFRYVRREGNLVQLEGLTFRLDSENAVTVFLAIKGKDGRACEETYQMRRRVD